jgi:hypothetical protein
MDLYLALKIIAGLVNLYWAPKKKQLKTWTRNRLKQKKLMISEAKQRAFKI